MWLRTLFLCYISLHGVTAHEGHFHDHHDHRHGHAHYHGLHTSEGTNNLIPDPELPLPENYEQPVVVPLHKFYSQAAGDHLYTTNESFLKKPFGGYVYEGIACYVSPEPTPEMPDAFGRFFAVEPYFDSFYTALQGEIQSIRNDEDNAYKYIGIAAFCSVDRRPGQCPLFRLYHNEHRDHFYSTNQDAPNTLANEGWSFEGVACYVYCNEQYRRERHLEL